MNAVETTQAAGLAYICFRWVKNVTTGSGCYKLDRRNRRRSHTTRCRYDVGVVGAITGRRKRNIV